MSLIETRIQNWRVLNPNFDKNMTRPQEYGALDFFIDQSNMQNSLLTPEMREKALRSIGTTVQMPVIDYDGGVTVSNTRSCTIVDLENTSKLITVTFATYAIGFTMVPAMYSNNEITYNHDWTRKIEKIVRALGTELDQAAVAALEAGKTQVFKDLLYYTQTGNDIQVPWDTRNEILGDVNSMMRANEYPGLIHIIGNAGIDSMIRKLDQHAQFNDVNKRLEYIDKVMHYTNNVLNESGKFGTFFAAEDGNVAMLTRLDRESLRGAKANDHEWSIVRLPYIDMPVGSHYYTSVGDQSAIAGASTSDLTCAVKEHFGFSVDVAFVTSYNSDPTTIANPIMKAEIISNVGANAMARPVRIVNDEANPVYTQTVAP